MLLRLVLPLFLGVHLSIGLAVGQEVCNITSWNRPNDLDLDTVNATQYSCEGFCQYVISTAIDLDRTTIYGNNPLNASLYATSANFTSESKPGDLLAISPYINETTDWQIPTGSTLYLIEYVTLSINNEPVPATGFVVLPYARYNDNRLSVVAFAHGTIGVLPGCGPSTSFNLYDYSTVFPLQFQGYAVVATDYQGLGNNYTKHPYLASTIQAKDVYYSVVAAKRAFQDLFSDSWVAIGHSEGGAAVLSLGTSNLVDPQYRDCNDVPLTFLGSVPISPAGRLADLISYDAIHANQTGISSVLYAPYIYWTLETCLPPGSASGFITDAMIERVHLAEAIGGCFDAFGSVGIDLALSKGANAIFPNISSLINFEPAQRFQELYGAGLGDAAVAPILIISGPGDKTIPLEVVRQQWKATCEAGDPDGYFVQLSEYPAADHSALPGASAPEWLAWIADRFAGRAVVNATSKCYHMSRKPIDQAAAYLPPDFSIPT